MDFDENDMAETIRNRQMREQKVQEKLASSQPRLLEALKDMVIRCAPDGTQDDGDFIGFYVLPTGPVHRALGTLQSVGVSAGTMGDVTVISRYQAHLKQLIEAEASRREREARIDVLKRLPVVRMNQSNGYGVDVILASQVNSRIAELKSQGEHPLLCDDCGKVHGIAIECEEGRGSN